MAFTLVEDAPAATAASDAPKGKFTLVEDAPVAARSVPEELLRQVGLTVRAGTKGIVALPNAIGDALGLHSSEAVDNLLNRFLPKPENAKERVVQDVTSAMAGAGAQSAAAAAARPVSALGLNLAQALSQGPGLQVVSAGSGAGSAGIARENGAGPLGQLAAGMAGSIAPSAIQAGGAAAIRGLARGGEAGRLKTAENIKTFEEAGTEPTAGQATENRGVRLAETMLGKTPGSAGVMVDKSKTQAAELSSKVGELADQLSTKTGATPAGRAIKEGVVADGGFRQYFKERQGALYDKLDQFIPKDRQVDMTNTANALADLNADIPGAPELSKFFKNARMQGIERAMESDTQQFTTRLPYEAMKKLRTLVGKEMADSSIVSDVPRSKWTALYSALSKDMEAAAGESGPQAVSAWERANNFTAAGMKRLETLDPIIGTKDPEDIFRAATSGMQEGASTIRSVMRSLPDNSQRQVAATVLKRMGLAAAGKQDATGEVFSTETFLTNWNKISPEARQALFSKYGFDFTNGLDKIAKVAANIREGSKIFANPSGTEAALTSKLGIAGIVYGLLFGHPGASATLAGGMAGAHVGAKYLLTNPDFVKWLARSTGMPAGALPGQITALENIAARQQPDAKQAMQQIADQLKAAGAAK